MAGKHALTLLHCVIAAVLIPAGLHATEHMAEERRMTAAAVVRVFVFVIPAVLFTRIAWAAGYAAGRTEAKPPHSI